MPALESLLHERDELFVIEQVVDRLEQVVLDERGLPIEGDIEERRLPMKATDHA